MIVQTKSNCWLGEINDKFLEFVETLYYVWGKWGNVAVITSGCDGKHMEGSKHYKHLAWDVRVWGLRNPALMADALRDHLNATGENWIVLYGDKYHQDHMHVQTKD